MTPDAAPVYTAVYADHAPTAAEEQVVQRWATRVGMKLVKPLTDGARTIAVDFAVGQTIDQALRDARDAIGADDRDGTDVALERARRALDDHPELPHAAFLRAEWNRVRAVRQRRLPGGSDLEAAKAWQAARVLDGGRARALGEDAEDVAPQLVTVSFRNQSQRSEVWVDGKLLRDRSVELALGLHHMRVLDGDGVRSAQWFQVTDSATVDVPGTDVAACSEQDFARTTATRCGRWLRVTKSTTTSAIQVSRCALSRCGGAMQLQPEAGPALPGWLTWVALGSASVLAAGFAITAAFGSTATPTPGPFVNGGISVRSWLPR